MYLSVIIPSFNNCGQLPQCLDSLLNQEGVADIAYEIIVVDNMSTDRTRDVIRQYARKSNGTVRYLCEKQRSPAHARNHGIRGAKGNILAFTDDDCIVDNLWMANILKTFRKHDPDALQGAIILASKIPQNTFYSKETLQRRFAHVEYGKEIMPIPDKDMVGANMSYKRDVFDRHGFFSTKKVFRYCEDTEFSNRITAAGAKKIYNPEVVVYHHFNISRLTKYKLLRQSYWWARASILMEPQGLSWGRYTRYCLKELVLSCFRWLGGYCPLKPKMERFERLCQIVGYWARCVQLFKERCFMKKKSTLR